MVIASKARFLLFWPAFLLVLSINSFVSALDVPTLRARVNDLAKILTAEKTQQLEERLRQFERETRHQIAVLTIPSLEGDPIEDFGIRVAEAWQIGQKGAANGVILIVAHDVETSTNQGKAKSTRCRHAYYSGIVRWTCGHQSTHYPSRRVWWCD